MASKGKINDIIDFQAVDAQKKQLLSAIDEIVARMEKVSKNAISLGGEFKGASKISEVTVATEKLGEANKEVAKILAQKAVVEQKIDSLRNVEAKALAEVTEQLKKRRQEVTLEAKINEAQAGSIAKMRVELSKLKKEWAETGDSAKRNALGESISKLNSEVLEAEKSIGIFGRQVGNYEIVGKSLRGELKAITEQIAQMKLAGQDNTEAYAQLIRKTGEMKDAMEDATAEIKKFASDTGTFDQILSAAEGVSGGFAAIEGASALLGVENEELQKTFVKLQAAMTLVNGLKSVQNVLQKESAAYTMGENIQKNISIALTWAQNKAETGGIITRKLAAAAQWMLNMAMKANPAGLLLASLSALIAVGVVLFKVFSSGTDTTEKYNTAVDKSKASVENLNRELDRNIKMMEAQGASQFSVINEKKKAAQLELEIADKLVSDIQASNAKENENKKEQLADALAAQKEAWDKVVALNDDALVFDFKQRQEADKLKLENMKDGLNKEVAILNADYDEKLRLAEGNNDLINQLEIAKGIKKNEIIKKYNDVATKEYNKLLEEERNFIDESLNYLEKYADAYKKIEEKKEGNADPFMAQVDAQIETMEFLMAKKEWQANKDKKQTEDEVALAAAKRDKLIELGQQTFDSLQSIANSGFEKKLMEIDAQAQADEEAKQKELDRAGNNAAAKDRIEAKYAEKEKQREAEKRKIQLQQAKFNKMAAMFQIGIDTAVAIMNAMKESMYWMVPIIGAMGALQLATVAAQPLPKYFKGRDGGPAEFAWVGERGTEAIELPGGKTFLTPDRPTLTFLPEHASVIPHEELLRTAGAMSMQNLQFTDRSDREFAELKAEIAGLNKGFDKVAKVIIDKKEFHLSISESGIQASSSRGASRTKYLNQNVRL